ncbi:Spn1 transposase [Streptococcus pneumoniae]|nr:Spn1 transposase [Streptococcus pneumoniae]
MGRKPKTRSEERTELERLQAENEYLRAENAILKKLRELRLKEEKEKTGELNHQVKGTKPRKVDRDRLKNYLTDNPDAYLTEIASEFGCHPTTIHYALKAMGYTRKKEPHLL